MEDSLNEIKKKIQKLMDKAEEKSIYGIVGFLEEALENIEASREELKLYELED